MNIQDSSIITPLPRTKTPLWNIAEEQKKEIKNLAERLSLRVTPYDWLTKAQSLRQASNHLLIRFEEDHLAYDEQFERNPDFDLEPPDDSVLMMLLGFAVENLLKGLYVSTLSIVKAPRTLRELGVQGHSLDMIANKIADALNEQFSKREFDILIAIEQSFVWCGRYGAVREVVEIEAGDVVSG